MLAKNRISERHRSTLVVLKLFLLVEYIFFPLPNETFYQTSGGEPGKTAVLVDSEGELESHRVKVPSPNTTKAS